MPTFTTGDGLHLAYDHWPPERAHVARPQPPVVLHHGFAADARLNWQGPGVVDALASAGREVVAHDARGHGRSDAPHDPARYGEATMAADVVALVDRLGFDAYDLVGYSMGAVVALLVAGRDARIRRLVVGGVGASVVEPPGPSAALDRAALADALEASDPATVTAPLLRAFRRFAERTGADLGALAAQARAEHPTPVPVDRVSAETLVLAGDRDPLAGRPEVLAAALGAELVVIPGDHLSAVADPHFVHELLRFLG